MVHDFKCIERSNGNLSVDFIEDGKRRTIIFSKNSTAKRMFKFILKAQKEIIFLSTIEGKEELHDLSYDYQIKEVIHKMRKYYVFKQNLNNVSVFYPVRTSDLVAV